MEQKKLTGYPSIDKPWLKYYSEEAINAKLPECTIYEYLWENNKDHLNDIVLNYFGRKITYGEMFDNIEKTAKAFSALGVKQGEIIVMTTVTTPETIYAFYGLNRIGAIANTVDPRTSTEGIKDYIAEVNAKIVLTIDVAYPKIEKAIIGTAVKQMIVVSPADSLPQPKKRLFNLSNKIKKTVPALNGICLRWDRFVKNGENAAPSYVPYEKDSCCVIVHTGGTTGMPKGVMLSNENLNQSAYQAYISGIDFQRKQTWLNIIPPFVAYGVGNGLHLPLLYGMETILIPSFNPAKFADLLNKYKPNHMIGIPSYYDNIIHSPKMNGKDLSYIIAPTVGGDSMRSEFEKETNAFFAEHNCAYQVTKGYGMTEVCAAVSVCVSNECNAIGTVGIPLPHTIISIFDPETGKELQYGKQGEICCTGPNTMLGYYNNQAATDDIIKKHDDGLMWVHSGDIGYMTENGFLYVVGRMKRMIVRFDGFKVFLPFIEDVVARHEAVESCCAVGVTDKEHNQGKLPVIHVVLKAEEKGKESSVKQELIALCQRELPEYSQPKDYFFRDALPLTPIGKVDYRALEKEAE